MDIPDIEISTAVNKLFILANLQENIMLNTPKLTMRHEVKFRFNNLFREVKKLNKLLNKTLCEKDIESFDLIAEQLNDVFNKIENK